MNIDEISEWPNKNIEEIATIYRTRFKKLNINKNKMEILLNKEEMRKRRLEKQFKKLELEYEEFMGFTTHSDLESQTKIDLLRLLESQLKTNNTFYELTLKSIIDLKAFITKLKLMSKETHEFLIALEINNIVKYT